MIRILLSTRLGERRMTQSELARATGIRSQTINELYHDFAERVSLDDLDLICEACGTDEALRDWGGNVKPLSDWVLVRVYNGDLRR